MLHVKTNTVRPFAVSTVGLVGLAWLALWVWGQSPYDRFLTHHFLDEAAPNGAFLFPILFVAGWILMVVAMMLPTSLPLISLFGTMIQQRKDHTWLMALLVAGYLSLWTLFGVLVLLADWGLHGVVERSGTLESNAWVLGAGTLVLAGLYQFTTLKYHCLAKCRSPKGFILERWQGQRDYLRAFRLGMDHGLFCIGCCWSLMLVMFAIGVGNLGWMLILGVVMGAEKNTPWGRRLSAPLGIALIGWGAALALWQLAFFE